jgi:membrane fusion protein, heavy metal efflux system
MMEEQTTFLPPHPDVAARISTRTLLLGALCGATAAAAVATGVVMVRGQKGPAAAPAPYSVTGDRVDIRAGSPTWTYLEFAEAQLGDPIPPEPVPARVAFDEARSEPIVAPLAGRVEVVAARLGQRVAVGDRLLAVRSPALVDLLKGIELLKAKESAHSKAVERLRSLVALKAEPEKDLVAAQQDLMQIQLARQAAEEKLRSLSVASAGEGLFWLTSPRDGVVVERDVLMGQEVGPDRAQPLMVVADLQEVIVTADVPEADVSDLKVGQVAEVRSASAPDQQLKGTVEYIGEVVDPLRRMIDVRVRVPNAARLLRPNAFVQVSFAPVGAPRVVVPASAVVTDDQRSFVFIRSSDRADSLQRRLVVPGHRRGDQVEINSGMAAGETYVTKGAILLLNAIDLAQG